ncbi:MAG: glycerophosphodiester phosphodiesterase family protein [Planctomycetota bacterium]
MRVRPHRPAARRTRVPRAPHHGNFISGALLVAVSALAATACRSVDETHDATVGDALLPAVFDEVREAGGAFVAAHRGGPGPGLPENALETLESGFVAGIRMFEVDVAESQDGVLYLMHDRSLRRTAGHDGAVADTDWDVVRGLDLRDVDGAPTGFHPPRLADVLAWAVERGALLELDRKDTTSFRNVVDAVRAGGAEDHVLLITYDDDEAALVARIAPELMMTAAVRSESQRTRLEAAGVDMTRVVSWLGTREPDPKTARVLAQVGIESAFGTLGRPGRRLDDAYAADGDAAEYRALVEGGITLIATDLPRFVADGLEADEVAADLLERAYAAR